jgi:hypothetical protein
MTSNSTLSIGAKAAYEVVFNYQSQQLTRIEWVTLVTLCLAPLVAHLLAGVPRVIYLHNTMPRWHDTMVLYNPTTIIWRYFATTERSICSSNSSLTEIAAINVIYWTNQGWQGSEAEIKQGKALCVQRAPHAQDRILSPGTLKTMIVAVQGATAAGALLPGLLTQPIDALGTVFFPLAFIGLLRLPAAYWLTDHFIVMHLFDVNDNIPLQREMSSTSQDLLLRTQSPVLRQRSDGVNDADERPVIFQRPHNLGLAVRVFYITFMLFALGICIFQIIYPMIHAQHIPLTMCAMSWLYMFLLIGGTFIMVRQAFGQTSQPISVPCANLKWYKTYTVVLLVMALATTIIAALETHRDWKGDYTAVRIDYESSWKCENSHPDSTQLTDCLQWANGTWSFC